jgi:putrescine transport system ATP-binding protein
MTLATRIGVMDRGEIVQVGTPREIYEYPTTRYVADFIGTVNLIEGRLVEDEPGYVRVECPEFARRCCRPRRVGAADGRRLGRDPAREDPHHRERPDGPGERGAGVVKEIAYMGDVDLPRALDTGDACA